MRRLLDGQGVDPAKLQQAKELRHNMTPTEKLLWKQLHANQVLGLHWRRQQVFAGYILDFYCHAAKLAVEVDGSVHLQQQDYDAARDELHTAYGLRVLRFTNDEVEQNIRGVLDRIAAACAGGEARLP